MKQIFSDTVGGAKLVIVQTGDGYAGTIFRDGTKSETIEHTDIEVLKAALRNEAGKLHPDYVGIDGAKARFRQFFPAGFSDPHYRFKERDYKDKARSALIVAAPLEKALDADAVVALACRKGLATNLLSRFESARLNEVLGSADGPSFVRAAAGFAAEPGPAALAAMEKAIMPHGPASWPLVTYLSFLWSPESQMFLKPEATQDFAQRVGHDFAHSYGSALSFEVYQALLDLAGWTEQHIQDLNPEDRIDVQSFIWVVGSYTDADLPGVIA